MTFATGECCFDGCYALTLLNRNCGIRCILASCSSGSVNKQIDSMPSCIYWALLAASSSLAVLLAEGTPGSAATCTKAPMTLCSR
jgi:hypothetical protein